MQPPATARSSHVVQPAFFILPIASHPPLDIKHTASKTVPTILHRRTNVLRLRGGSACRMDLGVLLAAWGRFLRKYLSDFQEPYAASADVRTFLEFTEEPAGEFLYGPGCPGAVKRP
jgi:hypothetical protein